MSSQTLHNEKTAQNERGDVILTESSSRSPWMRKISSFFFIRANHETMRNLIAKPENGSSQAIPRTGDEKIVNDKR